MSVVSERSRKVYLSEYLQIKHGYNLLFTVTEQHGKAIGLCILSKSLHVATCLPHKPYRSTLSICITAEAQVLGVTLLETARTLLCYLLLWQLAVAMDLWLQLCSEIDVCFF